MGSLLPDLGIKYAVERASCVSFPPGIVAIFSQEYEPEVLDDQREWAFDPFGRVTVIVAMDCNYETFDAPYNVKQVPLLLPSLLASSQTVRYISILSWTPSPSSGDKRDESALDISSLNRERLS